MKHEDGVDTESFEYNAIDRHFKPETGLHSDVIAAWSPVDAAIQLKDISLVRAVFTYKQYFEDKVLKDHLPTQNKGDGSFSGIKDFVNKIIAKTNKKKMAEYDEIVEVFNESFPKIVEENDFETLKSFHRKAYKLIRGKDLKTYD